MRARRVLRILIPIDFSAASEAALTYGKMLARTFGGSVHLLHVIDDGFAGDAGVPEMHGARFAGWPAPSHADVGARLCNLLSRDEILRFHAAGAVVFGTPSVSITQYAAEHRIDLIVMGTHGRGGVGRAVFGSVAEDVIRTASCPVLTVRQSGAVKLLNRQSSPVRARVTERA